MDEALLEQAVEEVAHWMVITALHDERLLAVNGKLRSASEQDEDVSELRALGCDVATLFDTLAFAAEMPQLYPPITAEDLKELARDVKSVLSRMKRLTPSIALPFVTDGPGGKQLLTLEPTGGDLHVWPALEEELQRKAATYEQLGQLCHLRRIPTRATFGRIAYVWPVVYINGCTGEPHYARASRLLEFVGISKTNKQLKVAFMTIRKKYAGVLRWMEIATRVSQDTAHGQVFITTQSSMTGRVLSRMKDEK